MPELDVRYCTTDDGVRIAYASTGDGDALVLCPGFVSQFSDLRMFAEYRDALGRGRRIILYDGRGSGLSERKVTDFSLDARVQDLRAVVAALRLRRFALYAGGDMAGSAVAVAYAARHPRQVSHLILYGSFIRASDIGSPEVRHGLVEIARSNWALATQTMADMSTREQHGDVALEIARIFRSSMSGESAARFLEQAYEMDIGAFLGSLRVPTLVLHRREDALVPFSLGRELAQAIPNARFVPLEGSVHAEFLGDSEAVLDAIFEFLGDTPRQRRSAIATTALATILFTDLTSSTALTQRLGDAKAQELVRAHNAIVREALAAHDGTEIKHTGDGIMASFPTASGALECAVAIQRAVAARSDTNLQVHIGLNAGEPVAEESDLFGTSVQLARRICDHAEAGQILAANVVRELAAGKGFLFADIGEVVPKGFEEPVRLYEVRWQA